MLIREMTIEDHAAMIDLLSETPGVTVREADSREATTRYLARNPGLSFVALIDGVLVEKAMGVLLILFGILIATDSINYIAQWMIETFPIFMSLG